jgi:arginyl-tRNA synthetase
VLLEDLLDAAVAKTREVIEENAKQRGQDMSEEEISDIAEKVGIGAVIYTYVKSGREKDIVFSWEEMLNFNGNSAPYLMYTYARIRSIMRKAKDAGLTPSSDTEVLGTLTGDDAYSVISALSGFEADVKKAAAVYEPFIISRSLFETASAFNSFYNNCRILGDDIDAKDSEARLALCEAVANVLKSGLYLLGIETVERM